MRRLIRSSLAYYRGLNALVVGGVAVAVAVLAGALLVGASVRESLRTLALARLGQTDVVISTTSTFREALADEVRSLEIAGAAPLVAVQAAVTEDESGRSASNVNVFGIDDRFVTFHGLAGSAPQGRDAWISPGLAAELDAAVGDDIVIRLARLTDIPLSHLQGRRDDATRRVRVTVARIVDRAELGEFSLVPAQGPPLGIFLPLTRLQQDLEITGRVNAVLVEMEPPLGDVVTEVREALAPVVRLDDLGLRLRTDPEKTVAILESRAGLLPDDIVETAVLRAADQGGTPVQVLTYLANTIAANGREIPYSLISAIDWRVFDAAPPAAPAAPTTTGEQALPPIRLNEWAVADLGVRVGDRVDIEYYLWSDQAGLQTRTAAFTYVGPVPMSGLGGDATLTPEYPGITDAGDVTSWDPPFPIELDRVRKEDEDYWDRYRAAPKAFVPLEVGQQLWPSVYGSVSSVRTSYLANWPPVSNVDQLLAVRDVRGEALAAASGTTDFGEYFVYFSFFLVVSGLLLAGTFFALVVEQRARELGLLLAVGFHHRDVRGLLLGEGAVLALVGTLIGLAGAVGYAAIIMYGLRTWWVGAVNTTALELHVDPLSLVGGAAAAMLAALAALALALRRLRRQSARTLLLGGLSEAHADKAAAGSARRSFSSTVAAVGILGAVLLVAAGIFGAIPAAGAFFGSGGLLMIAGCALFAAWLARPVAKATTGIWRFGAAYARWRPTRSVLSAALIAFACFVIVSVAAFRRDGAGASLARESGTGGFVLMAESVAPLMHNPNLESGRDELALAGYDELARARITRFRLRPGDEASCLTLYQPQNPRIIAPEPSFIDEGRFTFAASLAESEEERANPWLLLNRTFPDGAVPAVADQTSLTYVFHLAVGDDFVFTPQGGEPIRLRIVGALADSVLQSEIVIAERDFVRLFPALEGYRVWMIEAPEADAAPITTLLEDRLSDFGVDVTDTRARLAAYHQVEDTYLSTFQALGALGLLLGTLGLAAVLARNVLERRRELGLLSAVGFTRTHLRTVVTSESLMLVGTGVAVGTLAALVAIAPAITARATALPVLSLAGLVTAVIATGLIAAIAAVRAATTMRVVEALKNE